MLMIEISNRDPTGAYNSSEAPKLADSRSRLKLDQVLLVQSRLRHIYPPFFDNAAHGDCPSSVVWKGLKVPAVKAPIGCRSTEADFKAFTDVGAEPPVYEHWQAFFGDKILPWKSAADRDSRGLFLQQLLDDRMPGLSFIAVDDPNQIDPGDKDRFGDADRFPAFDPTSLNYDPGFIAPQREGFKYTRFRHYGTTYYCNGTSFAAVCNTSVYEGKCFSDVLLGHFRRHYTHLAVIAQFQHAALLYFAYELADTVEEFEDSAWKKRIRKLQKRFLKFRTRSYFTEVSNQIQGKDLYSHGLPNLGKTRAVGAVTWLPKRTDPIMRSAKIKSGERIVTLQTDCLMTNPSTHQDPSKTLHDAYAEYWRSISGGSLKLCHFFARQSLHGGYLGRRFGKPAAYEPYLLTDRGSVFILKSVNEESIGHIDKWAEQGLPLPQWAEDRYKVDDKKLWATCPFLREVGFGEIAVDLECHTNHPLENV